MANLTGKCSMIVSYFDSVVMTGNLPIVIFLKWAFPGLFFNLLSSFQTQIKILQQMNVKKCPSSIRCRDSNSQPLEHESPTITTRPGLPPVV